MVVLKSSIPFGCLSSLVFVGWGSVIAFIWLKMLFLSTLNRGIFPKVRVVSFEKLFEKPFLQQQKENVN